MHGSHGVGVHHLDMPSTTHTQIGKASGEGCDD